MPVDRARDNPARGMESPDRAGDDVPRPSRKDQLLDAGVLAVLRRGAVQTSLEALCEEVGVTKGAFFHHFRGKDDFVAALVRHYADRGAAYFAGAELDHEPTATAHLEAYLSLLERIYERDAWFRRGCMFLILSHESGDEHSEIRHLCVQGLERWLAEATRQFQRISAKSGRKPSVRERDLAEQLLVTVKGALLVGRARARAGSVRRALRQFGRYAVAALRLDDPIDKRGLRPKHTVRYVAKASAGARARATRRLPDAASS
jgi:TetR/AcrR family transcriptional repressor of nem operon